ncbi:MAG: NFACT family protein [Clostridia bacterium]|nr:NFACT family protein [Clostridia bacterium]
MPMDGVTFHLIAHELNALLAGGRVDKITQPERDEVIITVRSQGDNHNLLLSASAGCARAHITKIKKSNPLEPPNLCMLMRKHLIGGRIRFVRQALSDRILEIGIDHIDELGDQNEKTIVCEFMGKHSNIILINKDGRIMESARRVNEAMSSVREVLPGLMYIRPPEHGKMPFDALDEKALSNALSSSSGLLSKALSGIISGLSAPLSRELAFRVSGNEDARLEDISAGAVSPLIIREMNSILSSPYPSVQLNDNAEAMDLLAFEYKSRASFQKKHFPTLSEAIDNFYYTRDLAERMKQKSAAVHKVIKNNIDRLEKKIALQLEALEGGEHMEEYRIKGELLSACPHLVKKGMKTVFIPNYYDEALTPLEIQLDEKLNATANAQKYFKLYRKAQSAKKLAEEQRLLAQEELIYLEGQMGNLTKCTDESSLWELRSELVKLGYIKDTSTRRQVKALPPSSPFQYTAPDGTEIFVGRNNLQNEKLTFSAEPNEWWMHVKDAPGSHVIIKSENPTDETMLFAAKLTAKHSSLSAGSNVPVDYTRRKFVKKPSGSKPGFVIYTHQRTVFVTPE